MMLDRNYELRRTAIEYIKHLRNYAEEVEKYDPILRDKLVMLIDRLQSLIYQM